MMPLDTLSKLLLRQFYGKDDLMTTFIQRMNGRNKELQNMLEKQAFAFRQEAEISVAQKKIVSSKDVNKFNMSRSGSEKEMPVERKKHSVKQGQAVKQNDLKKGTFMRMSSIKSTNSKIGSSNTITKITNNNDVEKETLISENKELASQLEKTETKYKDYRAKMNKVLTKIKAVE